MHSLALNPAIFAPDLVRIRVKEKILSSNYRFR